jgi:sugar phosphate permease
LSQSGQNIIQIEAKYCSTLEMAGFPANTICGYVSSRLYSCPTNVICYVRMILNVLLFCTILPDSHLFS